MPNSLRQFVLRLPVSAAVLLITGVSVLLALLAMLLVQVTLGDRFNVRWQVYVAMTTAVPMLVAGPVSWVIVRLLHELEAARKAAQAQAWEDELTGVLQRRRFIQLAEQELQRACRAGLPVAVVLMDLDDFKSVNDRYGHAQGDLMLQAAATACASALRSFDLVARWGGEEFALLLPGADESATQAVCERVRVAVAQATAAAASGAGQGCTVSIGAVVLQAGQSADLDAAVRHADAAMYAAKHAGKNRVMLYAQPV
jgi:diguanylate cyclase (GGDEF)-like protein